MKTETLAEIDAALERYLQEVDAKPLAFTTKVTYKLHASNFVRWLHGDFEPGGNVQRRR